MDRKTRERLEASGWDVYDDAGDWLQLTDEDRRVIELHHVVGRAVEARRTAAGLSQRALAEKIGSTQSRVANVEAGHTGVSLNLAFRCLFGAGGELTDLVVRFDPMPPAASSKPAKKATLAGRRVQKTITVADLTVRIDPTPPVAGSKPEKKKAPSGRRVQKTINSSGDAHAADGRVSG